MEGVRSALPSTLMTTMRTHLVIEDTLLEAAMRAGPYKTRKEAVEAGLRLLVRRTTYRDLLALRGRLRWDDAVPIQAPASVSDESAAVAGPVASRRKKASP
jgi:antitoxin ParD1/3/4